LNEPDQADVAQVEDPLYWDQIQALKNIIEQIELLISSTVELPENRTARCRELLRAADALVNDLMEQSA